MNEKFKVLLALDNDQVHKHLSEILKGSFDVKTAHDAEEVYHLVHHFHPDLAVVDYALKNINPIELYEGIEFLHPDTTYVLCANEENMEVAKRVWRRRAIDYIRKPIDKMHLADDIHKITRHIIDIRRIKKLEQRVSELEKQVSKLKKGEP